MKKSLKALFTGKKEPRSGGNGDPGQAAVVPGTASKNDGGGGNKRSQSQLPSPLQPQQPPVPQQPAHQSAPILPSAVNTTARTAAATPTAVKNSHSGSLLTAPNLKPPTTTELKSAVRDGRDTPEHVFRKDAYRMGRTVGSGSYGVVREAEHRQTRQLVAIKMIDKARMVHREERLRLEIEILLTVQHRNLLRLVDWGFGTKSIYLVTELARGGELFDIIVKNGQFYERDAATVMFAIVDAVKYLHSLGIVHRDLKPENIFMRDAESSRDLSNLVIGDFGIARILLDPADVLKTQIGSPGYIAPEVLMKRPYGKECDMWSVGVMTYILLSGMTPFKSGDFSTDLDNILSNPVSFDDPVWSAVSPKAMNFIDACMQIDPQARITAANAIAHPWFAITREPSPVTPQGPDLLPGLRDAIDHDKMMRIDNLVNQVSPGGGNSNHNHHGGRKPTGSSDTGSTASSGLGSCRDSFASGIDN